MRDILAMDMATDQTIDEAVWRLDMWIKDRKYHSDSPLPKWALQLVMQHAKLDKQELRAALEKAYIAMRLAAAIEAVSQEYDFSDAIRSAQSALYGKKAPQGPKQHRN